MTSRLWPLGPQVDGKTNPKIQSIHLEDFPVHQARFSCDGEMVVATSPKNRMFYLYDMMEGRVTPVHAVRGEHAAAASASASANTDASRRSEGGASPGLLRVS